MSVRKDKERNTWYFVVSNRNGKPKQIKKRGFKTERDAQIAKNKVLYEINNGLYIEPTKMKVNELVENWLKRKKRNIQESTYTGYDHLIRKHIKPYFNEMRIDKVKPNHIEEFYDHLYDEVGLSGTTVQRIHTIVKSCFDYGKKMELISKNPVDNVDRPKQNQAVVEVWDNQEVRYFLGETKDDPLFIAYHLAVAEGMRQGEILGLRWKDIDFNSKKLTIHQTLRNDGKELKPGAKNKSSLRSVFLTEETLVALKEHKIKQDHIKSNAGSAFENLDLVICTNIGTPVNPSNLRRSFNRNIKNLRMRKIVFHGLRHTHATICLQLNMNPKVVADRLGHADVRITLDTYSHLLPSLQNQAVNQISQAIFG
ncbi:tyrosine-type recombinase/integrase [Saliterribacillus persicus]|uniref:Site-specific recombinase XerD n=1 Tax=Saliterribacillus persicus TaxID=930114 RepID=A0A368X4M3_9BACI|nr:tyrosine-type recombinase/integrase [Saliterribacillus persicus]RCW62971.1 site-specific recombinase XerD [Saliterribacillus persicus]